MSDDAVIAALHHRALHATLGELRAAGFDGLAVWCGRCRVTAVLLWGRPGLGPGQRFADACGRMRCRWCGTLAEPTTVRPYLIDAGRNPARSAPDGWL